MEQLNIIAVTQARCGSTRLPNKILKSVNGKTLLQLHIERILGSKRVNQLVVATTTNSEDSKIVELCRSLNVSCFCGNESNVLDRFYQAVKDRKPSHVVRLTSDCPLIDPVLIDEVIDFALKNKLDYASNVLIEDFPDGQDIEVMTFDTLEYAWKHADKDYQKEHVTPFIRENSSFNGGKLFRSDNYGTEKKYGHVRLTVDEQKDLDVITAVINDLGSDKRWYEYAEHYLTNESIQQLNSGIKRNEGFKK